MGRQERQQFRFEQVFTANSSTSSLSSPLIVNLEPIGAFGINSFGSVALTRRGRMSGNIASKNKTLPRRVRATVLPHWLAKPQSHLAANDKANDGADEKTQRDRDR